MDEYGAMVEWYLQGKTEVLGEKNYTPWVVDEWMSMGQWWNDTDRGNWSAGRKKLYTVGGRWMDEYGAMVEWYWKGKTEILWKKIPIAIWSNRYHTWNDLWLNPSLRYEKPANERLKTKIILNYFKG